MRMRSEYFTIQLWNGDSEGGEAKPPMADTWYSVRWMQYKSTVRLSPEYQRKEVG